MRRIDGWQAVCRRLSKCGGGVVDVYETVLNTNVFTLRFSDDSVVSLTFRIRMHEFTHIPTRLINSFQATNIRSVYIVLKTQQIRLVLRHVHLERVRKIRRCNKHIQQQHVALRCVLCI